MSRDRTRDLAAIHAAAKAAGIDEDTRREMIARISGGRTRSAADLGPDERATLLKEIGGRTRPARAGRGPKQAELDDRALLRKVEAQLADARLPWRYAEAILRRQRGIADAAVACPLERATAQELRAVIAALYRRAKRAAPGGGGGMTQNKDRAAILRRLRACLALSASPEPHEAAAALRQAEALMRQHGFTHADAALSEVAEHAAAIGRGTAVPRYLAHLAATIADVMGCAVYQRAPHTVFYVGTGGAPQIATYCYIALGRQLLRAREAYRRRSTRGTPNKRTARADAWALGWAVGAGRGLAAQARPQVVDQYMTERHPHIEASPRDRRPLAETRHADHASRGVAAGRAAGLGLRPGVGLDGQAPALPGGPA